MRRNVRLAIELGAGLLVSLPLAVFSTDLAIWQIIVVGLLFGFLIGAFADEASKRFGDRR